jgi:hypothetical protein
MPMGEIIQLRPLRQHIIPELPKEQIPPPSRLLMTQVELSMVDVTVDQIKAITEAYLEEIAQLHKLIEYHLARARRAGALMETWKYEQPDNPA